MDRRKGIAYCGLACALCSESRSCPGCRDDGCVGKESCRNLQCCRSRGFDGCWECAEFPCEGTILDNMRVRTFAEFVRERGVKDLLDCLERNEKSGLRYHYPEKLSGDYDLPRTPEGIIEMILSGRKPPGHEGPRTGATGGGGCQYR